MNKDFSRIQTVVDTYFDLVYMGAPALPDSIYENAYMMGVKEGKLVKAPIRNLILRENTPQAKGDPRRDTLVKIDMASDSLAYAKVKCDILPMHYTDILVMVKDKGNWKIVSKLWSGTEDETANWYDCLNDQIENFKSIEEAVARYIQGVYTLDSDYSLREFHEETRMINTNEAGEISDVPIQVLKERWENVESAKELGIPLFAHFDLVDMTGPDTALVKVYDSKLWSGYYDYLSLAKLDGVWKIINKVTLLPMPIAH